MSESQWMYRQTCPFCGKKHFQRMNINIICPCGAKYYFYNKEWLNRKTGEWRRK